MEARDVGKALILAVVAALGMACAAPPDEEKRACEALQAASYNPLRITDDWEYRNKPARELANRVSRQHTPGWEDLSGQELEDELLAYYFGPGEVDIKRYCAKVLN